MNKILGAIRYAKTHVFVQVFICMLLCITFYPLIPIDFARGLFTMSKILQNLLMLILPFYIFGTLISSFSKIKRGALGFTLFVFGIIAVSNFTNSMLSYFFGRYVLLGSASNLEDGFDVTAKILIEPFFDLSLPALITDTFNNTKALIGGVIIGLVCSFYPMPQIVKFADKLNSISTVFILKIFTPFLPIFVSGFILKICMEGQLAGFFSQHLEIGIFMLCFSFSYFAVWLFLAAGFRFARAKTIFKNLLPPSITAFTASSSAAGLPLSIEAGVKNTNDPILVNSAMPIHINAHMPGCTLFLSMMILITITAFHGEMPSTGLFAIYSLQFTLNKFSGAAVPGNTLFISLYLMRSILHFTDDMIGFITAFYMVLDSLNVLLNTASNNIFIIFIKNIVDWRSKLKKTD